MIEAIAIGLGAIWFGYKWFVKRQIKYIVLPLILIMGQLTRWPFFLNHNLMGGLIGIVGGIIMLVEFSIKKQIASVYPYIIIILFVSCLLLIEPLHAYLLGRNWLFK